MRTAGRPSRWPREQPAARMHRPVCIHAHLPYMPSRAFPSVYSYMCNIQHYVHIHTVTLCIHTHTIDMYMWYMHVMYMTYVINI